MPYGWRSGTLCERRPYDTQQPAARRALMLAQFQQPRAPSQRGHNRRLYPRLAWKIGIEWSRSPLTIPARQFREERFGPLLVPSLAGIVGAQRPATEIGNLLGGHLHKSGAVEVLPKILVVFRTVGRHSGGTKRSRGHGGEYETLHGRSQSS